MGLMERLKRIPPVYHAGAALKRRLRESRALPDHIAQRRMHVQYPIKVGFFCQYIPGWAKLSPLYDRMKLDARFEPMILCVPDRIGDGQSLSADAADNEAYRYCCENGYAEAINMLGNDGRWVDLEKLGLAYVFYPRPYNGLMPACYSTHRVRRFCRICHINYGITLDEAICTITLNQDFMADVCYYFAETDFAQRLNRRNNALLTRLGLQRSLLLGAPVLEQLFMHRDEVSTSWDFSVNRFRAIWTPRWTTDKAEGGSNFFTYYKALPDYARQHPEMDFLFRPHPLTFSHFVQTGEMTVEQVETFKRICAALPNVQLDPNSTYLATLWGSSVLISDYSSLMVEYFLTGKPIIFCASNMEMELAEFSRRMLFEGSYVVYNEQELFATLENLARGIDPLVSKRQELIRTLFGEQAGATERIVEFLANT